MPRGRLFLVSTIVHKHVTTIGPFATSNHCAKSKNGECYYILQKCEHRNHFFLSLVVHMQHPELPLFSFISALLVILPLSFLWHTRNVAVLAFMSWLFIANIIYGINSLVWAGNIRNSVPVWCDISQWFFFSFNVCATTNIFEFCSHENYRWCLICIASLYLVYL